MLANSPVLCPNCGRPMRPGRVIPAFERQPELQNYDCRVCDITVTQSVRGKPANRSKIDAHR